MRFFLLNLEFYSGESKIFSTFSFENTESTYQNYLYHNPQYQIRFQDSSLITWRGIFFKVYEKFVGGT